jgi:hypothetical protein
VVDSAHFHGIVVLVDEKFARKGVYNASAPAPLQLPINSDLKWIVNAVIMGREEGFVVLWFLSRSVVPVHVMLMKQGLDD